MSNYLHNKCDLCGSENSEILINAADNLSMTSDSRIIKRKLNKIICSGCGLVREGADFSFEDIEKHYKENYVLNVHAENYEHAFFRDGKKILRSEAISEWFAELLESIDFTNVKTALEVGAGQGNLLSKLRERFSSLVFKGYEVNLNATKQAQKLGLDIRQGGYTDIEGKYDLIYAFGVFEHVASPSDFLNHLFSHLNDGGYLILGQPMQNVESYDVFFSDHIHHFNTVHVDMYGSKTGFLPLKTLKSPWFANNFSLHLFKKDSIHIPFSSTYIPDQIIKETIKKWKILFNKINELDDSKNYAIYGLSEIACLLFCYTTLSKLKVLLAIDDFPKRHKNNQYNINVKSLNELTGSEIEKIDSVIFTMSTRYIDQLEKKCREKGLTTINIFK